MKIKENAKAFYVTDRQNEIIKLHKKQNRISTSKQMRLLIDFVFRDEARLEDFNKFVTENKGVLI